MNGVNGYRLGASGIIITFFTIITATVLLPMVLFNPNKTTSANAYKDTPYNQIADPERGRRIYVREGCVYCHTQFTRLQDRGYGPLVKAGDYVSETPHQLGTARTGPDLTNEGGRMASEWQKAHLIQPRAVKPGSIMPSFSFLTDRDMNDLVAYLQTMGNGRKVTTYVQAPDEYEKFLANRKVDTASDAAANAGRGIYTQNCAVCHGLEGRGNGPNSITLEKKPANFTRAFYKQYPDAFWFYRVREGVPGTRMPHFGEILSEEQMWYLVAYLKTLPKDQEEVINDISQLNEVTPAVKLPRLTNQVYEPASGDGHSAAGHEHGTEGPNGEDPGNLPQGNTPGDYVPSKAAPPQEAAPPAGGH
jgi:cytochrome c oxidase cbb3-type subunit II